MTVESLRNARLWWAIINFVILALWAALYFLAPGLLHRPYRWLGLFADQIDAFNFGGILLSEMGIIPLNLVPSIALRIVA